jgi:hypothetical protein
MYSWQKNIGVFWQAFPYMALMSIPGQTSVCLKAISDNSTPRLDRSLNKAMERFSPNVRNVA